MHIVTGRQPKNLSVVNNNNYNNNKHIYRAPCMPTEGYRGAISVFSGSVGT